MFKTLNFYEFYKMSIQIRDTEFGQLLRRFSKSTYFQYPDEIDGSIRRRYNTSDGNTFSPASSKEAGEYHDVDTIANSVPIGNEQPEPPASTADEKPAFLIDWYGQDDPEVSDCCKRSSKYC